MTYFRDLTPYTYAKSFERKKTLNVGWLNEAHSFATGEIADNMLAKLRTFTKYSVCASRGSIFCPFCELEKVVTVLLDGEEYLLGTAEVRVISNSGTAYAAPNLLLHYIEEHSYRPPDEFLDALMLCPLPPSPEYMSALEKFDLELERTPLFEGAARRYDARLGKFVPVPD